MTELKPCPFCGETPRRLSIGYAVICDNEECFLYKHGDVPYYRSSSEVVEAWNTRYERIAEKVPGRMRYGTRMPMCSECGQSLGDKRWSYCPNCGARVVEVDE